LFDFQEVLYLEDVCHNEKRRDFRQAKSQDIIPRRNLTNFQDLICKRLWLLGNRLENVSTTGIICGAIF
jgi:hypothetical protein